MATKLFLRETTENAIGSYRDMVTTAGSSVTTGVVNTTASGTQIQWTKTAGGSVLEWISGRVPSGGFTLSGTMTFSLWCAESNMSANIGARARVFKRTSGGSESEVGGGPYDDGVELTVTTQTEMTWTGTPTSTGFSENDRIIVRYYITNVGTMASGHTGTMNYDAADAATGDSFFQINENVTFKAEDAPAVTGDIPSGTLQAVTASLSGEETYTGEIACTLPVVTAALSGLETYTGTIDTGTLQPVTSSISGAMAPLAIVTWAEVALPSGSEDVGVSGTLAGTLAAVTAALTGAETYTGDLAGSLQPVTAELTGAETYTGEIAGSLQPVTAALEGLVVVPVEGTIEGTLPAVTAALIGDGGASLDAWGPVYARGYYDRLKRRRKKKREELEALRAELRILLGLDPVPAGAGPDLEPLPEAPALPPFALVELDQAPLRQQVAILMEALKERETALKAAFDDDEAAILALMEAA
jgi:hypothetical protein